MILVVLNCCPFVFFLVVYRNRDHLSRKAISEKIGTLYEGFNPRKPLIASYSFFFLLRRSIFVVLTFGLFKQPSIQV